MSGFRPVPPSLQRGRGGRGGLAGALARRILLVFLIGLTAPLWAAPLSVTDHSGARLTFTTPPQRIVSLAPHLTELAYAAGLGDRLVAVTAYSDYPPEASKLPSVGDAFRLDWERLVALQPDLVLGWQSGLSARDRAMLHQLGLPLLQLEPHRLEEIPEALRLLGSVAGTEGVADAAARHFERRRDELHRRYAGQPPLRAYFQIAQAPLLTVNGRHLISDVLRLCGADNVFAAAPVLTPSISVEALQAARPELLFALAATPLAIDEVRRGWRILPPSVAARQAFIDPDLMSRSGPRILLGAAQVCEQVAAARSRRRH